MIVERMMPARVAADRGVKQKYIFLRSNDIFGFNPYFADGVL